MSSSFYHSEDFALYVLPAQSLLLQATASPKFRLTQLKRLKTFAIAQIVGIERQPLQNR